MGEALFAEEEVGLFVVGGGEGVGSGGLEGPRASPVEA